MQDKSEIMLHEDGREYVLPNGHRVRVTVRVVLLEASELDSAHDNEAVDTNGLRPLTYVPGWIEDRILDNAPGRGNKRKQNAPAGSNINRDASPSRRLRLSFD